jgi:hypothetical protein
MKSPFWNVTRPELPRRRPTDLCKLGLRAVLDRLDPDGRDIYEVEDVATLRDYLNENLTEYGDYEHNGVVYTADVKAGAT